MVKAIVCFDLDGTLMQDDKTVAPDTLKAINALQANGSLPVIATGRNRFEVAALLAQTQIDTIVAANGSEVAYRGQTVKQVVLPTTLVADFTAFAAAHADPVGWYNASGFALSGENADTKANYQLLHLNAHVEADWYQHHPVNFMFVFDRGHEALFQQRFKDELSLVRNNVRGLDVMKRGVSKQTGLSDLIQAAHLTGVPTYAFGDAANDLPMFEFVEHPIAMGNATPEVKAQAEFVTTSNMAHGIANGLQQFGLI